MEGRRARVSSLEERPCEQKAPVLDSSEGCGWEVSLPPRREEPNLHAKRSPVLLRLRMTNEFPELFKDSLE